MNLWGLLLVLVNPVNAIPDDFDGFFHFRNWDGYAPFGESNPYVARTGLPFSTGTGQPGQPTLPIDISKDLCATDPQCDVICCEVANSPTDLFSKFNHTNSSDYDTYLGNKTPKNQSSRVPAASCELDSGGGNTPGTKWVKCDDGWPALWGTSSRIINSYYPQPPAGIYAACLAGGKER
jgi:hypothetical protein